MLRWDKPSIFEKAKGRDSRLSVASPKQAAFTHYPFFHEGKSALDVIYANRDFAKLEARPDTPNLEPAIDVVRMPETKYVLVMETSSSMSRYYPNPHVGYTF